ncbi:hypothetical protein D9757_013878 [Collybiopsis confluens]|uniref:Uncharacterized protein n=1 Tax=Collybiopsis confluens TaxID=2823264 RepID=A0A8H5CNL7_9AGAR|nr:hypothetical protein D9757_013878 [Collybiopsis confluens]
MTKSSSPSSAGYSYKSSGSNSQGNQYCPRDYGNVSNSYHYSNRYGAVKLDTAPTNSPSLSSVTSYRC